MLLVVNYHYIGFDIKQFPKIYSISKNDFLKQINFLKNNFEPCKISEIESDILSPNIKYLVSLDDGLKCQYKYAFPLIKKEKIPSIFFINTLPLSDNKVLLIHKSHVVRSLMKEDIIIKKLKRFCDVNKIDLESITKNTLQKHYRYDDHVNAKIKYILNYILTESQKDNFISPLFEELISSEKSFVEDWYINKSSLNEISENNIYIGSHTHTHSILKNLSDRDIKIEFTKSKTFLENLLDKSITHVSYPSGNPNSINSNVLRLAKQVGFNYGFTMFRGVNDSTRNFFNLKRIDCNDLPQVGKKPIYNLKENTIVSINI